MNNLIFSEIAALQVYMNNITATIPINNEILSCSYMQDRNEILSIGIMAYNKSTNAFQHIAGYRPSQSAELLTNGAYLNGRVTLSNITQRSTQATIVFNEIRCVDETLYKCTITYLNTALKLQKTESPESFLIIIGKYQFIFISFKCFVLHLT